SLMANAGQEFELDGGNVVGNGGDLAFNRTGMNMFQLNPSGGASIWAGNATPRGYATCFAQRGSANYVTNGVNVPANGSYACYVTSDGHVGELRIDSLTSMQLTGRLAITYTTWQ